MKVPPGSTCPARATTVTVAAAPKLSGSWSPPTRMAEAYCPTDLAWNVS